MNPLPGLTCQSVQQHEQFQDVRTKLLAKYSHREAMRLHKSAFKDRFVRFLNAEDAQLYWNHKHTHHQDKTVRLHMSRINRYLLRLYCIMESAVFGFEDQVLQICRMKRKRQETNPETQSIKRNTMM